jgi:hypothetical protein
LETAVAKRLKNVTHVLRPLITAAIVTTAARDSLSMSNTQKKQHYVWRHHLESWSTNGKVYCRRIKDKKSFQGSAQSIASQNYFYQIGRLSEVDVTYITTFINKLPSERLRIALTRQLDLFQFPYKIKDALKNSGLKPSPKLSALIEQKTIEFENTSVENWHGQIEVRAVPLLAMLKDRNSLFWEAPEQCSQFLYFLCHQFFRTPRSRKTYEDIQPSVFINDLDMNRIWALESLMFSTILGLNLYAERDRYKISFLDNFTEVSFITADQPVINLKTHHDKDVSLYFPLSPNLAMILSTDDNEKS